LQHVNVKFFVDGELSVDMERFIEVFHGWVAKQSFSELLIDVADYRHVPAGPGVVMVGHEADYAMDNRENRPGLLYNRKAALAGSNEDRFVDALKSAARVCLMLEQEFDGLQFCRQQLQFCINDRALAPNNEETLQACQVELPQVISQIAATDGFSIEYDSDPRRRFGGTIKFNEPIDLDALAG